MMVRTVSLYRTRYLAEILGCKMVKVKFSEINNCLDKGKNKFLRVNGLNTRDIDIEIDMDLKKAHTVSFVVAACISKDSTILDLVNKEDLSERNIMQLNALSEFLKNCEYGIMKFGSIRDELIQFDIITKDVSYQVEVHLGIHNYCICEDFVPVSIDAYR